MVPVLIDRSHGIGQHCVLAETFDGIVIDDIKTQLFAYPGSPTTGRQGDAFDFKGSGGAGPTAHTYVQIPNLSSYFNDEATLMVRLKKHSLSTDGWMKLDTVSLTSHYPYSGVAYIATFRNDSRFTFAISGDPYTDWHWVIVRTKSGGNWEVLVNDVSKVTTAGLSQIYLDSTYNHIGAGGTTSLYNVNAFMEVAFLFNKYLTDEELHSMREDPYQFLAPI